MVTRFRGFGMIDENNIESVTVADKIINSPFESDLASLGKI